MKSWNSSGFPSKVGSFALGARNTCAQSLKSLVRGGWKLSSAALHGGTEAEEEGMLDPAIGAGSALVDGDGSVVYEPREAPPVAWVSLGAPMALPVLTYVSIMSSNCSLVRRANQDLPALPELSDTGGDTGGDVGDGDVAT